MCVCVCVCVGKNFKRNIYHKSSTKLTISNNQLHIPLNQPGHRKWVPLLYLMVPWLAPIPFSNQYRSDKKYQLLVTPRIHHCSHSQTCLRHSLLALSLVLQSSKTQ